MLASIPVNEMADTLRVLAGGNAANAARHFTKRSYEIGDVASAVLWSTIAQYLGIVPSAAPEVQAAAEDPAPLPSICEDVAMQDAWFEDVDAEALAAEETPPVDDRPIPKRALAQILKEITGKDIPAPETGPDEAPAIEIEFAKAA